MKDIEKRHKFLDTLEMIPHKNHEGLLRARRDVTEIVDYEGEAFMVGSEVTYINKNTPSRQKQDLLNSKLLAQLAANKVADKLTDSESWYKKYIEVLENVGFAVSEFQFIDSSKSSFTLRVDKALIELVGVILSQNAVVGLKATMDALKALEDKNGKLTLFTQNVTDDKGGRFQISAGDINENGNATVSMGAFFTEKHDDRGNFLWITWGELKIKIFAASQQMELDEEIYSPLRQRIIEKLGDHANIYIKNLDI